ncbi:MAG TPA: PH domain-containing protein [Candidatus Limnocylindrales bacterium]|nr:PH domain-containing protein [Candidatus Limnocylindrales bacterium]
MADITEPYPDVPSPTPGNEDIVDPTIPEGNAAQVTIRRHPFGIVALYLQAIVGLGVALGLIYFLLPGLLSAENTQAANRYLSMFATIGIALTAIFLLIATAVYRQNKWIVTDDSITQFTQSGIFRRQISELSMANIEDVSSEQFGILAEMFGFGTLKVETAGERSNFHFIYCPQPNKYAKIILDARERFIHEEPEVAKRANDHLSVPRG